MPACKASGLALFFAGIASILTAAAASFPKPDPDKAFPELKIYDAQGRPWRTAHEDWAGARQRVASNPELAQWLDRQRAELEQWMARRRDRVEWVCGWWHDFVSPKDGSHLTWTDQIPGEEVQFLHSPSDPRVELTPKLVAGWVFSFRGRHAAMIQRAAQLYRLTGEERYGAWAATQLDFYAAHLAEWPVSSRGARLYWQTLDEATNLVKYADTVRLLGEYAAPERKATWQRQFFAPTVDLLNRTMQTIHNIATWQRCAVAQVALVFGDEAMWREALDGKFGLHRQIAEGITSDYLWYEQSFGYNGYVVRAVLTLFATAGYYGRAGELAAEMAATENLMLSPVYLRMPDGHTPNPADVTGVPVAANRDVFADAYRVFPTTLGLAAAAGRRDWDTLLDPPPPPSGGATARVFPALPPVVSRNLESSRMALLKSGAWQVFFHYGQLTRSHAQAEALNFAAFYGDTDITHDPGTVGYGSPLHKDYYTRGLNHNVPLLNGEGQVPPQPGELLSYSAEPARVSAAQSHYRDNARARRTLAIDGDTLVDTVSIESTKRAEKLGLALHLQGRVRLPENFVAAETFAAGRPASFGYWRNVRGATFRDRAEFDVDCGKIVIHVTLATPGEFKLWHGSAPDVPPKRRESFYLELVAPATAATFTTTFTPKQ